MQIAQWLKMAPPDNITAVTIEAVVSYHRGVQNAFKDGVFPPGSLFEQLPDTARAQFARHMRSLNTVMATTAQYAIDATANHHLATSEDREIIEKSWSEMQDLASTIPADIETPLLLGTDSGRGPALAMDEVDNDSYASIAAAGIEAAVVLRQAVLSDGPCRYSCEIPRDRIVFGSSSTHPGGSSNNPHQRRFKFGTMNGRPIITDKYKYMEAPGHDREPYPQTLQQVRRMTGLLCHPKRQGFHILPCAGFFRDRVRQELGLVFEAPPSACDPEIGRAHV